jgi:hypothetical protein
MPLFSVEGIFKEGKVELSERPAHAPSPSRVIVTFLPEAPEAPKGPPAASSGDRDALRRRLFETMERGLSLGGTPYPTRDASPQP